MSLSPYLLTVSIAWVAGIIGGLVYARQKDLPAQVVAAALPALLIEIAFYLGIGFEAVRQRLRSLGGRTPWLIVATALLPYLVLSLGTGTFSAADCLILAALVLCAVYWFRIAPSDSDAARLIYLAFASAVFLSGLFGSIYVNPAEKPALDIAGRLMWIRVTLIVLLLRNHTIEFKFLPERSHWLAGLRYYLVALPVVLPLGFALGIIHSPAPWTNKMALNAIGTFFGFLLVVALAEEFFFRGQLQPAISKMLGSEWAGLVTTSLLFGSVHLGFRGFPNWRFALLAAVTGVFYGLAFSRGGSFRAAVVTHALVVTTWRVFFI